MFSRLSERLSLDHPQATTEMKIFVPSEEEFHYPRATIAVGAKACVSDDYSMVFRRSRTRKVADSYIAIIPNAIVLRNGFVLDQDGRLVLESLYPWDANNAEAGHGAEFFQSRAGADSLDLITIDEAVHLRSPGEPGFFHWMQSTLPRAILAKNSGLLPGIPLMVNLRQRFASESFDALDIRADILDPACAYRVKRLYFPSPFQFGGDHYYRPPLATNLLRSILPTPEADPSRKVYISRSDASIRLLTNEGRLMPCLEKMGFEVVVLSTLSFLDQIELFNSSKIVVSPHGAGLANSSFMRPGSHLIEIVSPQRLWPTFKCIADRGGISYSSVCGNSYDMSQTDSRGKGNEDFEADAELICEVLDSV